MQSNLVDSINFMLRFKNKSRAIRNILKLQATTEWRLHETDPEQWKILSHKLESLETSRPCCFYSGGGSLLTHLSKHMDLDKWKLRGGSAPVLQVKTLKIKSLQIFLLPSLKWQSTAGAVALYQFGSQGPYFLKLKWKEFLGWNFFFSFSKLLPTFTESRER